MTAKTASAVTVQFNRRPFVFKTKAALVAQVTKAAKENTPPDAKAKGLKHRISLPGLKAATSLGWVALHLFDTAAIGTSANDKTKGAYHPAQVLAAASKLAAFGVKVESDATSPRYANWSTAAKAALTKATKDAAKATKTKAKTKATKTATKTKAAPVTKAKAKATATK